MATKDAVFAAVESLSQEHGPQFSVEAIAKKAGCSKQTLYAHFGSRNFLLQAMLAERLEKMGHVLDEAGTEDQTLTFFAHLYLETMAVPLVALTGDSKHGAGTRVECSAGDIFKRYIEAILLLLTQWMSRHFVYQDPSIGPGFSAELFIGMVCGLDVERQRFALQRRTCAARRAWVARCVSLFLETQTTGPAPSAPLEP